MNRLPEKTNVGGQRLQRSLEAILEGYARVRETERFGIRSSIWTFFEEFCNGLRDSPEIARFRNIRMKWSAGQGRWASVPWVAALDARETTKTSRGVYAIYLFRADLSAVYLTLNQGTSWFIGGYGRDAGAARLRARASKLREYCGALKSHGFELTDQIDLRSSLPLVRLYPSSTVAFKRYDKHDVPEDGAIVSDLSEVLAAYEKLVPSRRYLGDLA
jgi:hypothetical protein